MTWGPALRYTAGPMRILVALLVAPLVACGSSRPHQDVDAEVEADACVGLQCRVVDCAKQNLPATSISGTVFAPNGTLALYGATVYVPNIDPGPLADGVSCARCDAPLPGQPIVRTLSDEAGHFKLDGVPYGTDVPVVIQIGKWRKQVTIPMVTACQDNAIPGNMTSLPRSTLEGDMPKIAIATGGCDALECLVRRLGVDDSEFTTMGGSPGRIHLFAGGGGGANKLANGKAMVPATTLWGDVNKLKDYDVTMLSCECSQEANTKPQTAMNAIKMYADMGGRVFGSHYHNVWIGGETGVPTHAPAVWKDIATWNEGLADPTIDTIDQSMNNPKGSAFAMWMVNVMGSTSSGQITIENGTGRQTAVSVDNTKAERWVYYDGGGTQYPQNFQFTTPNEMPKEQRCGKVVFSDMHVASGSSSSGQFPTGCATTPLSAQEKALAFMFFDVASCVGTIL